MHESDELVYSRFLATRKSEDMAILLDRHRERLILFIYGYVHNLEDAEDLMIDTFATVAAGRSLFSGRSSFRTWLYSIGHNLALMHLRKNRVSSLPLDTEIADESLSAETEILKKEQYAALYEALKKIPEEYRQVLYLMYFEDMPHEEIARIMGVNKKKIYNLADRGKAALKQVLSKE